MKVDYLGNDEFIDFYIKTLEVNPPARSVAVSNLQHQILFANQPYLELIELIIEDVVGKKMR